MSQYVDLSEKVTATFYDEQYEEWTQKTVTIADVLDSVCDDYTVLPSAQPEPIKLHVDHALTEEEIKNLKQKIADSPIVLMPYEKPKVIHCKDCRYYEWMSNRVPEEQTWYCHNWNTETGKDDYCSYAERRQDGSNR